MMGVIALLFLGVMLVLIGIGVVAGVVCVACAGMMVALGMVSTSVLLALLRRQISTGFRALHYQSVILGGLLSGTAAAWSGPGPCISRSGNGTCCWPGWLAGWRSGP